MKKILKYATYLALLVMAVGLLAGCCPDGGKVTGGGWFMDREGFRGEAEYSKVTFGFVAQGTCECCVCKYKGQFQAVNHGTKEKIHVNELVGKDLDGEKARFEGVDKDGFDVKVTVWDRGEPGASEGDEITIKSQYGIWRGDLEGGNIQIH